MSYSQVRKITMNEEVLKLVMKHPDLLDKFTEKYRGELFVLYLSQNPIDKTKPKYAQVADIYNQAYKFKVSSVSRAIQQALDLKRDNANMLIGYAKAKNLITESVKTNHAKGYLQKNYVPKSEGIKK
jgi:hypothetical protein